jgi:hypothetical protein
MATSTSVLRPADSEQLASNAPFVMSSGNGQLRPV